MITGCYDMNINFELYRVFYVVANVGNITKASKELCISQPAVTKQIKSLEDQLGGELFIRTKRGVILTENGKGIYNYIKQGMSCFEAAELQFSNLKRLEKGILRVGVSTTLARLFLLKYLDMFHREYPNIAIQIFTDPSSILRQKLKDGSLDILLAKEELEESTDLEINRVGILHHCFIAGEAYNNLKNKEISLKELNDYPILLPQMPSTSRDVFDKYCHDLGVVMTSKLEVSSATLLEDMVRIGLGIGLVTKEYAQLEIDRGTIFEIKLEEELPSKPFALILLKNSYHSFGANQLKNLILKEKNKAIKRAD